MACLLLILGKSAVVDFQMLHLPDFKGWNINPCNPREKGSNWLLSLPIIAEC